MECFIDAILLIYATLVIIGFLALITGLLSGKGGLLFSEASGSSKITPRTCTPKKALPSTQRGAE